MTNTVTIDPMSCENILLAFEDFRDELDDYNDRRERLIKVCIISLLPPAYLPH